MRKASVDSTEHLHARTEAIDSASIRGGLRSTEAPMSKRKPFKRSDLVVNDIGRLVIAIWIGLLLPLIESASFASLSFKATGSADCTLRLVPRIELSQ